MAIRIEAEPAPRPHATPSRCQVADAPATPLPRSIRRASTAFFDVLSDRRSATGEALSVNDLSSLLWHSTFLRERRPGRFGIPWESRSAPSAGGLHPIRLIALPIEEGAPAGLYQDHQHALVDVHEAALTMNRANIREIFGRTGGTTIQLAADASLIDACYEHASSLMWRDAGALAAIICLVATALGLVATPMGRTGEAMVRAAGLPEAYAGVGAVHVGSNVDRPS